jgi:hypothetical protein
MLRNKPPMHRREDPEDGPMYPFDDDYYDFEA